MATDPQEIQLTDEQRKTLADLADTTGKPWREVFSEALHSYRPRNGPQVASEGQRSFYDVMLEDGAIGIVKEGLSTDVSTNPKHMEGFGRDNETGAD
jgi:hypothetical protein